MKKQTKKDFIIIGSILLFLLLGLIVYINLNDKVKPFKTVITKSFDYLDKGVERLKNTPDFLSDNKVSLEITDSNESINLNLDYSSKNKYIKLDGTLGNNKLTYYYLNNNSYLKSPSLSNTYNINYDFKACTEEECLDDAGNLNDIIESSFLTTSINYELLKDTETSLKKVFLNSLEKRYITKKSMTTSINKKDTKVTKYSYVLNKNSLTGIINNINSHKTLKDNLFTLFGTYFNSIGITKDNFKDLIGTKDNLGTINIYTTSYNNIAKINLTLTSGLNITINLDKDITTIDYVLSNDISGKITVNSTTHKTNITYYYKGNNSIILDISNDNKLLSIDYNIYVGDNKYTGTISNETLEDSNNVLKGIFKVNNISLKYDIQTTDDLTKEELTNYTTDFTATDKESLENIISSIENDNLIKTIVSGIKALEN